MLLAILITGTLTTVIDLPITFLSDTTLPTDTLMNRVPRVRTTPTVAIATVVARTLMPATVIFTGITLMAVVAAVCTACAIDLSNNTPAAVTVEIVRPSDRVSDAAFVEITVNEWPIDRDTFMVITDDWERISAIALSMDVVEVNTADRVIANARRTEATGVCTTDIVCVIALRSVSAGA